jgi:hypothetical protein
MRTDTQIENQIKFSPDHSMGRNNANWQFQDNQFEMTEFCEKFSKIPRDYKLSGAEEMLAHHGQLPLGFV